MMVAIPTLGLLTMGLTTITAHAAAACPDPGQCTCNSASGVMTDHAMAPPFNRINNGCTSADAPSELPSSGSSDNGGSSSDNGGSSSDNGGSSSNDGGS
jgi:uncharacterized membrane protein YgcG